MPWPAEPAGAQFSPLNPDELRGRVLPPGAIVAPHRGSKKNSSKGIFMVASSTTLHEASDQLKSATIDIHRAVVSLIEELEAFDWYNQRAEATQDPQLQAVLKHNRDEEIEHASMTLEWIRRNVVKFDEALKTYLFTQGDITAIEEKIAGAKPEKGNAEGRRPLRLTVGEMKGS
ncbi:MAG TPA: ferritin-like domain-containing protein [Candidatus Binatia bacterium]